MSAVCRGHHFNRQSVGIETANEFAQLFRVTGAEFELAVEAIPPGEQMRLQSAAINQHLFSRKSIRLGPHDRATT